MPIEIRMPALSPTMTEGNLARWLKHEGDKVAPGDVIAEIETDKATMEVEAVDEGTLGKIVIGDGTEGVPVNTVIGVLLEEGEEQSTLEGYRADGGDGRAAEPQREERSKVKTEAPTPASAEARGRPAEQAARPAAAKGAPEAKAGNGAERGGRIFASPLAKRMAKQAGIDLAMLEGSGPHGRIIKVDVERAIQAGVPEKARPAAEKALPAAAPARAEAPRPAEAPGVAPAMRPAVPARRTVRGDQAFQHAQGDRAPAHRSQADDPALLPDRRLRAGRAAQAARRA